MGRFTGVLLVSDFDNTLIYTEAALKTGGEVPPLSEKNRNALEYFIAEGGSFAVATGRALAAFARHADQVPMNVPAVVCNGAALYDFEKKMYLEIDMLDGEALRRAQAVMDHFPEMAVEAYHINNMIYAARPNEITRRHERMVKVAVTEVPQLSDVPLPLGKLLFEADRATLEEAKAFLTEQGWEKDYELIFSNDCLMEMTVRGADKGSMVRRLAERLGIAGEHIYCAGDESNDLSMLRLAEEGFAPANCASAVRESGVTLVAPAWEDAMAEIVMRLDARYSVRP